MLLVLLFAVSLAAILGFIAFTLRIIWLLLDDVIPQSISVIGYTFSTASVVAVAGLMLFFLIVLLFYLLYLVIDRMIVRPMKSIASALHEFAEHNHQVPLPPFSRTTNEVRWMAEVFVEFTDSVEQVHKRDMEVSLMKSDFISTAAHQLRTPMTGIRWSLEALQKSGLSTDQQLLVDSAVGKSHELVTIIGTLLDISSIESGKYHYKFVKTDMSEILTVACTDFEPMAAKQKVILRCVAAQAPLAPAQVDRERIKWVLNNLIENAIRYTPAGGTVELSLEGAVGRIFVKVKDTGIGIQKGDEANIFERFYRAPNAIQKENAGNGLGLYIARAIATDHGGDLTFQQNETGPGTTFILSLPLAS